MPHRKVGWMGLPAMAGTLLCSAPSLSAAQAPAADLPFTHGKLADGAARSAVCSACHGPNGNSVNPEWPRLAGQSAVYIAEQLRLFRSGVRVNQGMQPLATTLSDQDIDDLAVYYEAQTPTGPEADPSYWRDVQAVYVRGDRAPAGPAGLAGDRPGGRGQLAARYPPPRAQQS